MIVLKPANENGVFKRGVETLKGLVICVRDSVHKSRQNTFIIHYNPPPTRTPHATRETNMFQFVFMMVFKLSNYLQTRLK